MAESDRIFDSPLLFVATWVGGVMMALPMFDLKTFPADADCGHGRLFGGHSLHPTIRYPRCLGWHANCRILIGSLMGLVVRLLVASVEFAGELRGCKWVSDFKSLIQCHRSQRSSWKPCSSHCG